MFDIQAMYENKQLQLFSFVFMFQLSTHIDSVSVVYLVLRKAKEEEE